MEEGDGNEEDGLIRRLVCALFGHQPPPGVSPAMSIKYHCDRCQDLIPGELAAKKK